VQVVLELATEEFKILQKVQDLMGYSYPILTQFPKAVKFSFAQDIRSCMNKLLELTIEEEKRYTKKTTIQNMDIENEKLKIFIRVAYELRYIDKHRYAVWSSKVVEIGKMIGGLLKSVSDRPKS
jgi:four helix bundle protein